ncbi:hypothetical protein NHX12_022058 [Muraenolepis orangiensis]|uniref:Anaphase-promoting complex subunit 1 N-terminal domain-containing protein n=1 Tax=Muraenolepis orangiensis TaxID=630683 RepID=A0A9Q0EMG3_9TELE|nr:hypothetical protein NHX12_022058 [Muraenolepis orangiensis]
MIAAGELQLFVPFGRDHCRNHPNAFNLQLRQLQPASELWALEGAAGLVGSLQEVTLHERLQALWCNFTVPQSKKDASSGCLEQTVCILQSSCINVHSTTGKDFISPLPFQVSHLWATAFGLLLERKNSDTLTSCTGGVEGGSEGIQYVCDSSLKLVFSSSQPSILLCYDTTQGTHSIWALRTVTQQERSAVVRCPPEHSTLAPGLFTSHLRNVPPLDSPGGPATTSRY